MNCKLLFLFFFLLEINLSYGQKPALTVDSYKSWPEVSGGGISNNARLAYYTIRNFPVGKSTFILKTTEGKQLFSAMQFRSPKFSNDSRYLFGMLPADTLVIFDAQLATETKLPGVTDFELRMMNGKERLILKDVGSALMIADLAGQRIFSFENVTQYKIGISGSRMIIERKDTSGPKKVLCSWIDTTTGKEKVIYAGGKASDFIMDAEERQAAFLTIDSSGNKILYYNQDKDTAVPIADNHSKGIAAGLTIQRGDYWAFSKDGKRIFFSLKKSAENLRREEVTGLEVWSYEDSYPYSFYHGERGRSITEPSYLSVLLIQEKSIKQLLSGNQKVVIGSLKHDTDSLLLVQSSGGISTEDWNPKSKISYSLCFTYTGQMVPLERQWTIPSYIWSISPGGKYVVYYDPGRKVYVSYDIRKRSRTDLTASIKKAFSYYNAMHYPAAGNMAVGIAGWLKDDKAVLISTSFDILKISPESNTSPVSLTKEIGEDCSIVFYPADAKKGEVLEKNGKILLTAFNVKTKEYGFYSADASGTRTPRLLSMGKRYSGHINTVYSQLGPSDMIKSAGTNGYLLLWMDAQMAPNYYFSKDLVAFRPLSEIQPQKDVNWLNSELHSYRDSLGAVYQGVLYKPENFDPKMKYPVVFNIYENRSNELNAFKAPALTGNDFNIPLLVSNGYLVFLPDIRGIIGAPGKGALRSVMAAVDHLSQFEWVNQRKLGLVGHSFGGFETNYIITHSNKFAAAVSGAGISNMTTAANGFWGWGENQQYFMQYSEPMMGEPLYANPEIYIENSPIFRSREVTAPILFMHNDADRNVNVDQTRSFFSVLRSLHKPCWWLNYHGQGHGIVGDEYRRDFNVKVLSFLDHYLKGAPMPQWMKEHI